MFLYLREQITWFTTEELESIGKIDKKSIYEKSSKQQQILQTTYLDAEIRRQKQILLLSSPSDLIILDRGVEDTIFAVEHLGDLGIIDSQRFREKYYASLLETRASLVIMLDASLNTVRSRVEKRQRETGIKEDRGDYYTLFYEHYVTWFRSNVTNVVVIQTDHLSPSQVFEETASTITAFLGNAQ